MCLDVTRCRYQNGPDQILLIFHSECSYLKQPAKWGVLDITVDEICEQSKISEVCYYHCMKGPNFPVLHVTLNSETCGICAFEPVWKFETDA